jgi:hypothetical protein
MRYYSLFKMGQHLGNVLLLTCIVMGTVIEDCSGPVAGDELVTGK